MPKPLLDIEDADTVLSVESELELDQLFLKKDGVWRFRTLLDSILKKTYHQYNVKLTFNEEPFNRRIDALKLDVQRRKEQTEMFDSGMITELNREIVAIENEREDARALCVDIEFDAELTEVKYKKGTLITLVIPDTVIQPINLQRSNLQLYKIILSPNI